MLAIIENDFRPGVKSPVDAERLTIQYDQTRILFSLVQDFLEKEGEFTLQDNEEGYFFPKDTRFHGIGLPQPVLDKIYFKNFERLYGVIPNPIQPKAVIQECDRLIKRIHTPGALLPGAIPESSMIEKAKAYFELLP